MSCILNSHALGKLKDISLELSDESPVLIGKADFDLWITPQVRHWIH
jgi:hypothetical protein